MSLRLVKISSPDPVVRWLAGTISEHLRAGERVLWLVAGGSVIKIATRVARQLAGAQLDGLTVTLTDERPGPAGHSESNWRGLMEAGFELPGARLQPVLTGSGSQAETAAFNRFLSEQLERSTYRIGLFGIGPDGHTAGIPARHAAPYDQLAAYYESGPFRRLSITPAGVARLDEAVVYMVGENKLPAFERFTKQLPVEEQSAQALKTVTNVTVFNEFKGENQ